MIKKYKTTTIENPEMQYFEQLSRCCYCFCKQTDVSYSFTLIVKGQVFSTLLYFLRRSHHSQSQGSTVSILELDYPTSGFCKWTSLI